VPLTSVELEAVGLTIAVEALDEIANHSTLQILPLENSALEAEVRFATREHQQLFLIRLLDFVDENGDSMLTGVKGSCLDVLEHACLTKSFDIERCSGPLQRAVSRFQAWLSESTPLRLWLPTLNINALIRVPRRELLFIAGNQSKHNLSRLTGVSRRVAEILRQGGHNVPFELIPLALDDFSEHLHEDYFVYYGTWLAEHVVTIRWGVQAYLAPIYRRAYRAPLDGSLQYSYEMPPGISHALGKEWFWRLMNLVRRGPNVQPIQAAHYLKAPVLRPET